MIDGKLVGYFKESTNRTGCNFYRIFQPAMKLAERGNILAAPSSELRSADEKEMWFEKADVLVTQITSEIMLETMLHYKSQGRGKWVIDWDDDLYHVSPYNPAYREHGYKEVEVEIDGKKTMLWKDGENGFDIKANKKRLFIFSECVRNADLITTPSAVLSGMFKKINPNVKVLPNLVDFSIWNPLPLGKDEKVRIGWQGGDSHFEDWHVVKEPIKKILEANPSVVLVIMGTKFDGIIKDLPRDQVQLESWVPVEAYPHKFKTLNIDIGIAPLQNTQFNTCKSELKWCEYSALEIPCVCSNVPPYSFKVYDGITGFLCSNGDEWVDTLQRLVNEKSLRVNIGKQARGHVFQNYDLDTQIEKYEEAYKVLCGAKKELVLQ